MRLGIIRTPEQKAASIRTATFLMIESASQCMQTTAARAVNELWREHLFQLAITFHGGMRAISYEWGSTNHRGSSRNVSPDDVGFQTICQCNG